MPRVSAADGLADLLSRQLSVASRGQLLALGLATLLYAWLRATAPHGADAGPDLLSRRCLPRQARRLAAPAGVVAEVDSRAWHLSPGHWDRTRHRHDLMGAAGIIALHFSPAGDGGLGGGCHAAGLAHISPQVYLDGSGVLCITG